MMMENIKKKGRLKYLDYPMEENKLKLLKKLKL